MKHFLGLDLSLNGTGAVIIDSSYSIIKKERFTPPDGCVSVHRLFFLEGLLQEFIKDYSIELCCIEGPAYGIRDGGRLVELGEWQGIVKLNLFKKSIPYIIAVPSQLKKYVTGSGKSAEKAIIILDVYKKWGEELRDDNICDAYVLSRICHDYSLTEKELQDLKLTSSQLEVLKAIRKSFASDLLI
jgi:Holliday junction resolvasome RuvABC endonuclease subunit